MICCMVAALRISNFVFMAGGGGGGEKKKSRGGGGQIWQLTPTHTPTQEQHSHTDPEATLLGES